MYNLTSVSASGEVIQLATSQFDSIYTAGAHADAVHTIQGTAPSDSYWDFSMGGWVLIPPRTNAQARFNWSTKQWEDPRTLQDHKLARNAYINASRLHANQTSFMFLGKQISVDQLSRGDIDALHGQITFAGALPTPWVGGWKAMDNTYVAIPDLAAWGAFYKAMVDQGAANFLHAQELKQLLATATTPEEVEAITW